MQVTSYQNIKNYDLSKELWLFLFFNCVGFTVWPLIVYYLGRTLNIAYFMDLTLRFWAEEIIYGPLGSISLETTLSLFFLFMPYLTFLFLRTIIKTIR
tara:strand:+ start:997 stop:1290 length:294 start_codon:yes stop_codon:yes gene_type:complete